MEWIRTDIVETPETVDAGSPELLVSNRSKLMVFLGLALVTGLLALICVQFQIEKLEGTLETAGASE